MNYKETVESKRQEMVDQLLDFIESNPSAWEAGWYRIGGAPRNGKTQKYYNGLNAFWLYVLGQHKGYKDPRWVTYQQAKDLNASVKAGEKCANVFYWSWYDKKTKKPYDEATVKDMDKDERQKYLDENVRPVLKYYQVFNAEQCNNFPQLSEVYADMPAEERARQNAAIENIIANSSAPISFDGGNNAYYELNSDSIHLPEISRFKTMQDYYATALHEIAHSTGHASRLNRNMSGDFGKGEYAKEELRAELASVFMQLDHNISIEGKHFENHGAYLQAWLKHVREDKKEFFAAVNDAEKISQYVGDHYLQKRAENISATDHVAENTKEKNTDGSVIEQTIENAQLSERDVPTSESGNVDVKYHDEIVAYRYNEMPNEQDGQAKQAEQAEQGKKDKTTPLTIKSQVQGWSDWSTADIEDKKAREAAEWLILNNFTEEADVKRAFYNRQTSDMSDDIVNARKDDEQAIIKIAALYKEQQAEKQLNETLNEQGGQAEQGKKGKQGEWHKIKLTADQIGNEYNNSVMIRMPEGEYSSFVFLVPKKYLWEGQKDGSKKLSVRDDWSYILQKDGLQVELNGMDLRAAFAGREVGKSAKRVAPRRRNMQRLSDLEANVPDEMKALKNWCVFRTKYNPESDRHEKFVISPIDGKWAKSNDPNTWVDFDTALKYAVENDCAGLSFALDGKCGITCIDLDKSISKEGKLTESAEKLTQELADTYAETSVSGNGIHIFVADDILHKTYKNRADLPDGEIEVYDNARFISMTGNMRSKSKALTKCPAVTMTWLRSALGKKSIERENKPRGFERQSDTDVIERIRRSKKGRDFDILMSGGSIIGDKNKDDLMLLNMLAFFTDCNKAQMEAIFLSSGRNITTSADGKPKSGNYLERSIEKACSTLNSRISLAGFGGGRSSNKGQQR